MLFRSCKVVSINLNRTSAAAAAMAIVMSLGSCGKGTAEKSAESDSAAGVAEEYHADNDIAMTVRSIADAICVGEPLDTVDYNFYGVLTDGQGHPLYTDLQGNPGNWDVDVLSPTTAVIRNVDLGDLLPDDLEIYLSSMLEMDESNIVDSDVIDEEDTRVVVYDFGGGFIRIEKRKGVAPNGLEGSLMRITVTRER